MKKLILPILALLPLLLFSQEGEQTTPDHYIFSIYFGGGSYYVDAEQEKALYLWLESIPNIKQSAISVHSHTDDIGSKEYNDRLSQLPVRPLEIGC